MDSIIIFYSLLGHNEEIATNFARESNFDIIEFSPGSKLRVFQFFVGKRRLSKKAREIDIQNYNKILIYGPIWAGKPAPAILKLLENINLKEKEVSCSFTYTQDYGNSENLVKETIKNSGGICIAINFQTISEEK